VAVRWWSRSPRLARNIVGRDRIGAPPFGVLDAIFISRPETLLQFLELLVRLGLKLPHETLRQCAIGIDRRLRLAARDANQLCIELFSQIASDMQPCVVRSIEIEMHHHS
jgi:hypothetical protein